MGRWGDGIYKSDDALDYLLGVKHRVMSELAYWFVPEVITPDEGWLWRALGVVEIAVVLEEHELGSSSFLNYEGTENAFRRWRDALLRVWDADWSEPTYPDKYLGTPEARQQHRAAVVTLFDRLESIAHFWNHLNDKPRKELPALPEEFTLPYFSISYFAYQLVDQLEKDIFAAFSAEKRDRAFLHIEEVWVAVDLVGFLCEVYDLSPELSPQTVRDWRDLTVEIYKDLAIEDTFAWTPDNDPMAQNFLAAFSRLEAVAVKHYKE